MRYNQAEKMEIIRLIEGSDRSIKQTLKELGINKSSFYNWYYNYKHYGFDGLAFRKISRDRQWNQISPEWRNKIVDIALDLPHLSSREVACHITDTEGYSVSEASVYRILKERGLLTAPAYVLMAASDSFKDKTTRVNEMWQTDFTYFKVINWGWYYLSTVLDDYSRFIIAWDLCLNMTAPDVMRTVEQARLVSGLDQKPRLLSDNGSCYISSDLKSFLDKRGIAQVHGRPGHPQTQGKIERYHRSMKNVVKLDHYYSPEELKKAIGDYVHYYNFERYHESLSNLKPADFYFGQEENLLKQRKKIKQKTMKLRRAEYQLAKQLEKCA
jgi:transposase InsO family protein